MRKYLHTMGNIRNTGRVKRGLVNVVGKHCDRVSIVFRSRVMIDIGRGDPIMGMTGCMRAS
jgi:hypothetical protein